ncbi:MAG TPA: HIT family protein [Lysobacter sp.]|nr:HIT family protein [Lysobacter sp.]
MNVWTLHPQLAADTHAVHSLPLSDVRLMDDAQYPWLILVPRVAGASELTDLDGTAQAALLAEIDRACRALQRLYAPHKLNVAALGNVVPQLHVHVIARFRDDPAWPRPVWGAVPARPYEAAALAATLQRLRDALA